MKALVLRILQLEMALIFESEMAPIFKPRSFEARELKPRIDLVVEFRFKLGLLVCCGIRVRRKTTAPAEDFERPFSQKLCIRFTVNFGSPDVPLKDSPT